MFVAICLIILLLSPLLFDSGTATFLMLGGQLAVLGGMIRERNLTGAGAFIFMSVLFFGMRPLHLLVERDYELFRRLFRIPINLSELNECMWWATAGLFSFYIGVQMAKKLHARRWRRRLQTAKIHGVMPLISNPVIVLMIVFQVLSLGCMLVLGGSGRGLYGSAFGAYLYDLPVVLQSGHIFTIVLLLERYLKRRSPGMLTVLGFSGLLFLIFTWEMRSLSMFRGFYLTGLMIGGIAVLSRLRPRIGYGWLIVPIIVLLPYFRSLGEHRYETNEALIEVLPEDTLREKGPGDAYWNFFDARGDMNIFDTFVAAKNSEPAYHPYLLSWFYVPVHLVPRAIWKSKPRQGILVDMTFTRGAPYAPGIAGFFLLDGGLLWMLGCMALLGYLISLLDWLVLTMPQGYLRCCLYGIIVINALFLTRFFLWQYFYQVLYAIIPCILLNQIIRKKRLQMHVPPAELPPREMPSRANA